ncbi:MAG: nodulation protein NfeD [Proteobacteria bacterium]|nr:nodulation protein NfeD [Pseudomonadota bacterium]
MSIKSPGSLINRLGMYFLMAVFLPGFVSAQGEQQAAPSDQKTTADQPDHRAVLVDVQGPIGPATTDFLVNSLEHAAAQNAELLIIRLDTPGGLDASTRDIVKAILNSPVPVATFVAPEGARAASAGTYILYASHIAAMSPATNVGAATPVSIIPTKAPPRKEGQAGDEKDSTAADPVDAMSRKAINDAVAYVRGLAGKHNRNVDWAELAVREAASITAKKALEIGVIDLIAKDIPDLLEQVHGKTVNVQGRDRVMDTRSLLVEQLEPGWKSELLAVITNPTMAYLLLLIGVYGLMLEGYNPGAILPGVVGAICLLIALYAFQMLPVNYAGLALIILGIILMIGEAIAPSFGVLGIGGIISIVIGSIILIDTDVPGYMVSRPLIGAIALTSALGLMAIIGIAMKARYRPVVSGREQLVGAEGTALLAFDNQGDVFVHSERWNAVTEAPLREGEVIIVTGIDGLTLKVRPGDGQVSGT